MSLSDSDVSSTKAEIRKAALTCRDALSAGLRLEYAAAIFARILTRPEFQSAQTVMAYVNFGSEPDTSSLLAATLRGGKRLLLPKVNRSTGSLDVYRVKNPETDLIEGAWGISEPDPRLCAPCALQEIDFILAPGVAFDRRGGRIGYGRGYYDRLLAACRLAPKRAVTVAAAFEVQVVEAIPMEAHDVRMDGLFTEAGASFP